MISLRGPTTGMVILHRSRNSFHLNNNKLDIDSVIFDNNSITENGRVSYPIEHIINYKKDLKGNHPKNIIFLT